MALDYHVCVSQAPMSPFKGVSALHKQKAKTQDIRKDEEFISFPV